MGERHSPQLQLHVAKPRRDLPYERSRAMSGRMAFSLRVAPHSLISIEMAISQIDLEIGLDGEFGIFCFPFF
jgi:hypothetical protein